MTKKASSRKTVHPIEQLHPRSLRFLSGTLHHFVEGQLWMKVLIGMFLGISIGFLFGPTLHLVQPETSILIGEWLGLPGYIFIRIIQMIVIPLIFASIIRGIAANESMRQLKKTGVILGVYFVVTSVVAISIGLILAQLIQPGHYINKDTLLMNYDVPDNAVQMPGFSELPKVIGNILPSNLFGSLLRGEMLQIVVFTIIFGIALVSISVTQSKPLLEVLGALQEVCMTIVRWTMILAPFAVFGLMAKLTTQFGLETLFGIGMYVVTVLLGLVILYFFYLLVVSLFAKVSAWQFARDIKDVQLLAFSTSSSAAVMPFSMKTADEKLKIRPSVSQLVVPLGATINMDGTALYQAVATLFLAQVFGVDLSFTALLLLIITIVGASIGVPGVPGVGAVILSLILASTGIPLTGLVLILGVDRILDMSRTALNVTGDLTACVFVNHFVANHKPYRQVIKEERQREKRRIRSGEDVIIVKQ